MREICKYFKKSDFFELFIDLIYYGYITPYAIVENRRKWLRIIGYILSVPWLPVGFIITFPYLLYIIGLMIFGEI
jgi:hypothetical protein